MPVNASPEYASAEKKYLNAIKIEDRIKFLEEMIRVGPKHKSSENFMAELKNRLRRLTEKQEKAKKTGKSSVTGIKKEDMQAVIIGLVNSGKSALLSGLTNAKPISTNVLFSTTKPVVGMMSHQGVSIQVIEIPAIDSDYFNKGLVNTADTILILIDSIEDIEKIKPSLEKAEGKKIIVFNKSDLLSENEKRKVHATLSSKKYDFVIISSKTREGFDELKEKIFKSFDKIRIYTKEPGKEPSKTSLIMEPGSTLRDVAEKILKGLSSRIKETRIWGPSSKFPKQTIGLNHKLKDMDIVEFKTK